MKGFWKKIGQIAAIGAAVIGVTLTSPQEAKAELYPPTPDNSMYCSGPCRIELPAPSQLKSEANVRNYGSYNSYQTLNIQVYQPISYAAPQLQTGYSNYIPTPVPITSGRYYNQVVQLENNYIHSQIGNFQTPRPRSSQRISYNNYSQRQNFGGGQRRSTYRNYATPSRRGHHRR
jgi:hypothetical protein